MHIFPNKLSLKHTLTTTNEAKYLWVFLHESRFEIAMRNCNCDNWIPECTHERKKTSLNLRFSIPEWGGEAWLVSVFFWHADCYSILKCAVYWRKWLEGHIAPPPKSQFRGQGIHTAISLRDLRDASLENTSGPPFELRNSNYAYTRAKIPPFKWSVTWMIILIANIAFVWNPLFLIFYIRFTWNDIFSPPIVKLMHIVIFYTRWIPCWFQQHSGWHTTPTSFSYASMSTIATIGTISTTTTTTTPTSSTTHLKNPLSMALAFRMTESSWL